MIENLEELAQDILWNKGASQYFLLLLFDTIKVRDKAITILERELSDQFSIHHINISEKDPNYIPQGLYHEIDDIDKSSKGKTPCVFLLGLEPNISQIIVPLNSNRELFRFKFPLVFWLPSILEKQLMALAPDLFSFYGNNRYIVDDLDTELEMEDILKALKEFEDKFKMDSKTFYNKWLDGEMDENFETHDWALIYQLSQMIDKDENK